MCVCMYVCVYVRMYVCMYVCMCVCMCKCDQIIKLLQMCYKLDHMRATQERCVCPSDCIILSL
jgi:hypothetical protein